MLQHVLGGAVDTVRFRRFIDELIAEGLLVEVIQWAGVRLTPRHLLILTEQWEEYALHPRTVPTVRGRADGAATARAGCGRRLAPAVSADLASLGHAPISTGVAGSPGPAGTARATAGDAPGRAKAACTAVPLDICI